MIYSSVTSINDITISQKTTEPGKNIALFVWPVPDISRVKKKGVGIDSEHFFDTDKRYRMRLDLYIGGGSTNASVSFRIRYYIGVGLNSDDSTWPLEGVVSITIKDKINKSASQCITKSCKFDKPKMSWGFETFIFPYSSLYDASVLESNSILIECTVDS